MITKKNLLEAWEKSMTAKEVYANRETDYHLVTDFLNGLPDEPNKPHWTCKCGRKHYWSESLKPASIECACGDKVVLEPKECDRCGCLPCRCPTEVPEFQKGKLEQPYCEHEWKPVYGSRKIDDRTTFFDGPLIRYDCTKCGMSKCIKETKPECEHETKMCEWCGEPIAIRNPTGNCDHLYYPENVNKEYRKQPSWEKKFDEQFTSKITTTLSVFGPEITVLDTWHLASPDKIKDFIRAELKAMGEEIKRYIDINYDHESALLYSLVDEALRKRGVK